MTLKRIAPLINTDKLEEVKCFYTGHLGFLVTFESDTFLGLKSSESPSSEIGFMCPREGDFRTKSNVTLCFEVDDVDAECARLTDAGIPLVQPVKDNPWGDRSFMIADPGGTALYICHPIEPAPEFADKFKE